MNLDFLESFINFDLFYEILVALVIGVVQGVTEFLPVSSTAHQLISSSALLNGNPISLQASNLIQVGTLIAIVQYFWSDLKEYIKRLRVIATNKKEWEIFNTHVRNWFAGEGNDTIDLSEGSTQKTDITLAQIGVGTIPIIVLGGLLYNFASDLRSILMVAVFLALGSVLMVLAEKVYPQSSTHEESKGIITVGQAFFIGIFQSLAIFPGVSRSGVTLSGALLIGKDRKEATRFSFLLAIPAILIAGVKEVISFIFSFADNSISFLPDAGVDTFSALGLLTAFVASYIAGIITLRWLIAYLSDHPLYIFIAYRLGLAGLLVVWYFVSGII